MFSCNQITRLLRIILPRLAECFSDQLGAIFGFGPNENDNTGTTVKVEEVSQAKVRKLVNAPIHNLNEERSVGLTMKYMLVECNIWK